MNMEETLITKEEYEATLVQRDISNKIINTYLAQQVKLGDERWVRFCSKKEFYTDADLTYSADARCRCGAGLAYVSPQGFKNRSWICSDFLKGVDQTPDKHERFEFSFYEIKSELQPSACGRTTRPKPPES